MAILIIYKTSFVCVIFYLIVYIKENKIAYFLKYITKRINKIYVKNFYLFRLNFVIFFFFLIF